MRLTGDECERRRRIADRLFAPVIGAALTAAACVGLLVLGHDGSRGSAVAAGPQAPLDGRSLWISDSPLDDGRRLLLVVDPERRHAAVYHVDTAAGTLALKSTRDIGWDLMVGDFNAQPPKPADIRKMIEAGGSPAVPSR